MNKPKLKSMEPLDYAFLAFVFVGWPAMLIATFYVLSLV